MKHLYRLLLIFAVTTSIQVNVDAQCISNTHSPFENQGWLSCSTSTSPNPDRSGHWLMYDLGHNYYIDSAFVWNHNVWGETGNGVKEIYIDYSVDQVSWNVLGPFIINEAPGSWKYNTPQGLWMGDAYGRYFVVSVVNTWDGNLACAGFGELKMTVKDGVDVNEDDFDHAWSISPNPSSDFINLDFRDETEAVRVNILSALGQQVETLLANAGQKTRLDISNYEDGMYFVLLQKDGMSSSKSFVKVD